MKIVNFPEQTVVIAENQPEYLPLPAYRWSDDPQGRIACCWQLTWAERFKLLWSGLIWHQVLPFNKPLQPQLLSTDRPDMSAKPDKPTYEERTGRVKP